MAITRAGCGEAKKRHPLALTNPGGFDITDAVGLKDGGLIVLERRFRWSEGVKMRLRRIRPSRIGPQRVMAGEELLRANNLSYNIDNMEGLAAHADSTGRTILTIVSDKQFQ